MLKGAKTNFKYRSHPNIFICPYTPWLFQSSDFWRVKAPLGPPGPLSHFFTSNRLRLGAVRKAVEPRRGRVRETEQRNQCQRQEEEK